MTKLCDLTNLPHPLRHYNWATSVQLDNETWGVVLRRDALITYEPIVFRSTNKYDIRLAIREANEILSAVQRLKGQSNAQ